MLTFKTILLVCACFSTSFCSLPCIHCYYFSSVLKKMILFLVGRIVFLAFLVPQGGRGKKGRGEEKTHPPSSYVKGKVWININFKS